MEITSYLNITVKIKNSNIFKKNSYIGEINIPLEDLIKTKYFFHLNL